MQVHIILIVVISAVTVYSANRTRYTDKFFDYGVYRIDNRAHVGVLTFVNVTAMKFPPILAEFDDANAGQRWRLDQSLLYTAFELRPTLNENYVLEYWDTTGGLQWLSSWGFGNNRLWYLEDAGDGFTLIRNKHNPVCLESRDVNSTVKAKPCSGKHQQQWKLVYTS